MAEDFSKTDKRHHPINLRHIVNFKEDKGKENHAQAHFMEPAKN